MDTELRKRLEEAAELCQQYQEIYGGNFATAYMKGYTDGYKEAIKVAKEWLEVKVGNYLGLINEAELTASTFRTAQLVADFEADMNKLLEEKK